MVDWTYQTNQFLLISSHVDESPKTQGIKNHEAFESRIYLIPIPKLPKNEFLHETLMITIPMIDWTQQTGELR